MRVIGGDESSQKRLDGGGGSVTDLRIRRGPSRPRARHSRAGPTAAGRCAAAGCAAGRTAASARRGRRRAEPPAPPGGAHTGAGRRGGRGLCWQPSRSDRTPTAVASEVTGDQVVMGADGGVVLRPDPDHRDAGASPVGGPSGVAVGAVLADIARAARLRAHRAGSAADPLLVLLDQAVAELPVGGIPAAARTLGEGAAGHRPQRRPRRARCAGPGDRRTSRYGSGHRGGGWPARRDPPGYAAAAAPPGPSERPTADRRVAPLDPGPHRGRPGGESPPGRQGRHRHRRPPGRGARRVRRRRPRRSPTVCRSCRPLPRPPAASAAWTCVPSAECTPGAPCDVRVLVRVVPAQVRRS